LGQFLGGYRSVNLSQDDAQVWNKWRRKVKGWIDLGGNMVVEHCGCTRAAVGCISQLLDDYLAAKTLCCFEIFFVFYFFLIH